MPTYEYACTACGNEFERFESITAKPNNACPKCKAKKGERKISGGGGFIFKGTGFYITDYKKGGGAKTPDHKPGDGKPAEGKPADSKQSEAAPATTTSSEASSGGSCGSGCGCHPAPAAASKPAKSSAKSSSAK